MTDPNIALQMLLSCEPCNLSELPNEHGIYALSDHNGQFRYIGVTASVNVGFKDRIYSRHVTGSEGRSHKFSHAYNTGRMWRDRKGRSPQDPIAAKIAKDLRTQFCRKYCMAIYLPIPASSSCTNYFRELSALEGLIQGIAPEGMRDWERLHFNEVTEPRDLTDELLSELRYSQFQMDALARQSDLYQKWLLENR